jgi:hypothetical protein
MAKENKVSVAEYHKQLKDMKIRFPKENIQIGIPDYAEKIKEQAKKLGKKSANEYILDLIENDIQRNPNGLHDVNFIIQRDMREINRLKNSSN